MPNFLRKPRLLLLSACFGWTVAGPPAQEGSTQPPPPAESEYQQSVLPSLLTYCGDCHSGDQPAAGVAFEKLDVGRAQTSDRSIWKKVHTQIEAGIMPPPDSEQPSDAERQRWTDWIDRHSLQVACDGPAYPGRVTLRRLNRNEYNRTIRDLIGIDHRPADQFPSDDVGYGFDNIGDVLTLPPVLLERYLDAAEEVVRRAIIVPEAEFAPVRSIAGKTLASVGEAGDDHDFTATADYLIRVDAYGDQAGPEPAKMAFLLDGESLIVADVPATADAPGTYEHSLRVDSGRHRVAVKFLNDYYQPEHPDPKLRGDRNLHVRAIHVIGPIGVLPDDLPASHRRLIPRPPVKDADSAALSAAARSNLATFLPHAFRRPVDPSETERYGRIADLVLADEGSFERAMQVAVQAALVSPAFLFRVERQPVEDSSEPFLRLNDFELATRLSYFLWAAPPDLPLLRAAADGKLSDPKTVRQQIRRMLRDPRIEGLVEDFAGQWLQLRNLETIAIDRDRFAEFTPELRTAMRQETELLFASIIRENRSVIELLSADYAFLDSQLAKLYGIEGVDGDEFRRVSLSGTSRGGLLGQAAILTVTSNPTRTSPVKRGKWILENLLAAPPPPAPPNVPTLEAAAGDNSAPVSLREQLELHRSKAECAACHRLMDPLGFGLENFDAIGRWRDEDQRRPIDAQGELPDGRSFTGPAELRTVLLERQHEFRRCVASKLLTFALGRGLEYFDECTLDDITAGMSAEGDRFEALVWQIVKSRPFRFQARTRMPE
ncbi:MAG: DUF1592 domain-containing protein [Planctomycetaceae bacterium]|nr:MAG: DUF1592 domain-containing protein [Planctomycetaceae bacterium]